MAKNKNNKNNKNNNQAHNVEFAQENEAVPNNRNASKNPKANQQK